MRVTPVRRLGKHEHGFTIIEVLVAALVLVVGLLGVISMLDTASAVNNNTRAREQGVALARELIEAGRSIPYSQVNNSSITSKVQALPNLGDASAGPGWTIQRRGVTYTVAMGACTVDDPANGYGPEDPNQFCAASSSSSPPTTTCGQLLAAGIGGDRTLVGQLSASLSGQVSIGQCGIDLNLTGTISDLTQAQVSLCLLGTCQSQPYSSSNRSDDYKRIIANVTWPGGHYALLSTLEANPGSAAGPNVLSVDLASGFTNPILSLVSGTISFAVTTDATAAALQWAVAGAPQSGAAGNVVNNGVQSDGTRSWTINWNIGSATLGGGTEALDGNYNVSVLAYDSSGNSGAQKSKTITLSRRQPYAPKNFVGGHDGSIVDFLWSPNKEGDIVGYNVYRVGAPLQPDVLVCSTNNVHATSCQDTSPPASASIQYYVVAVEGDNNGAGDHSAVLTVTTTNSAPYPPSSSLQASPSNGNTVLIWNAPSGPVLGSLNPGPDYDGEPVSFYRIYRDGQAVANRYDTAPGNQAAGTTVSYTDTQTGGVSHTYWVTAVDPQLAESTAIGPVTK